MTRKRGSSTQHPGLPDNTVPSSQERPACVPRSGGAGGFEGLEAWGQKSLLCLLDAPGSQGVSPSGPRASSVQKLLLTDWLDVLSLRLGKPPCPRPCAPQVFAGVTPAKVSGTFLVNPRHDFRGLWWRRNPVGNRVLALEAGGPRFRPCQCGGWGRGRSVQP